MSMNVAAAEQEGFKQALASFASGVTVVTFWDEFHRPCGMTASSFSSVSLDPLLILICLNQSARTYEDVVARERFGVNILASECIEISNHCARPGGDKVLHDQWLENNVGQRPPVLSDSLAYLDCEMHSELPAGTHSIIVGRVRAIAAPDEPRDNPLLYYRGNYRELVSAETAHA